MPSEAPLSSPSAVVKARDARAGRARRGAAVVVSLMIWTGYLIEVGYLVTRGSGERSACVVSAAAVLLVAVLAGLFTRSAGAAYWLGTAAAAVSSVCLLAVLTSFLNQPTLV